MQQKNEPRVNFQIKSPTVRLVRDGKQLGVFTSDAARRMAQEAGLDLVEIAPQSKPPVCTIVDFGKFKFEQNIKEKEAKTKQRQLATKIKEIRLRPGIDSHDVTTKINQARKFIDENKTVLFNLQFRGQRELAHKEQGFAVMKDIVKSMEDVAVAEFPPKMEGNRILCRLQPKI